jgi:cytochrome c oxidase subunit 3
MLTLIASEATFFGACIGTYFYLRLGSRVWPPDGIPLPVVAGPVIAAVVLAATSVPVQLASAAVRAGRAALGQLLLGAALVVQCGYLAYQLHDLDGQLAQFRPGRDAYSSVYYTLLVADHAHVALGVLLAAWLVLRLARGVTTYRANAAHAIAWYWHFVNVLTLVVTAVLLSART